MRIIARTSNHQNEKKETNEEAYQTQYVYPLQGFNNPNLP